MFHFPSGASAKSIACPPGEPRISRIRADSGPGSSPASPTRPMRPGPIGGIVPVHESIRTGVPNGAEPRASFEAASGDPTQGGSSHRNDTTARLRGVGCEARLSSGPVLVSVLGKDADRRRISAQPDHHRDCPGHDRRSNRIASPFPGPAQNAKNDMLWFHISELRRRAFGAMMFDDVLLQVGERFFACGFAAIAGDPATVLAEPVRLDNRNFMRCLCVMMA